MTLRWVRLIVSAALAVMSATSFVGAQASDAQSLVGTWEGDFSNARGGGPLTLVIKEATQDRATGTVNFSNCPTTYCNKDMPFTAVISGAQGEENLQVTFAGNASLGLTRKGSEMTGQSFGTTTSKLMLKKMK